MDSDLRVEKTPHLALLAGLRSRVHAEPVIPCHLTELLITDELRTRVPRDGFPKEVQVMLSAMRSTFRLAAPQAIEKISRGIQEPHEANWEDRASSARPTSPRGWILKHVKLNGLDVTDKGVEFKPGEDVSGIYIELTNRDRRLHALPRAPPVSPPDQQASLQFLEEVRRGLPFPIRKLQCDSGSEFPLAFKLAVEAAGIRHRYIKPRRPQQNGKVERSHRVDQEEFWSQHDFATRAEADEPLTDWAHRYNHERFSLALLGCTPAEKLLAKQAAQHTSIQRESTHPSPAKGARAANGEGGADFGAQP